MQPPLTRSYPPIPALETQTDTILTSINMVDAHCSEDTSTSYIVKAVLSEYWKDISMTFKKFSSDKNPTAVDDSKKAPDAPVVDQPNPQPDTAHADVAPAPKPSQAGRRRGYPFIRKPADR